MVDRWRDVIIIILLMSANGYAAEEIRQLEPWSHGPWNVEGAAGWAKLF